MTRGQVPFVDLCVWESILEQTIFIGYTALTLGAACFVVICSESYSPRPREFTETSLSGLRNLINTALLMEEVAVFVCAKFIGKSLWTGLRFVRLRMELTFMPTVRLRAI